MVLTIEHTWDGIPAWAGERATVQLQPSAGGLLISVEAPFHGDPPPSGDPGPTWALWEHEVVELFLLGLGERYTEVELGPHGHHLVLRLEGVRTVVERLLPLQYQARIAGDRWTGAARLPWSLVPDEPLRANAYAIHGVGVDRRYLAWTPPRGPQPDFHRLESFPPVPPLRPR